MNDHLPLDSVPGLPKLFIDYILDFDKVRDLYRWDYRDIEGVDNVALSRRSGLAKRKDLRPILLKQNLRYANDRSVEESIERLCEGGCAVVTGQQIGLFGGPLYTMYKAATAIKLAEELNRRGKENHAPVFWMECEDHDILEIGHIHTLDRENRVRHLIAHDTPGRKPTGSVKIDEKVSQLIDQFEESSPKSEYLDDVLGLLRGSYQPGSFLSEGFARTMARLFEGKGLIIVDPTDPELKRLASPLYRAAVTKWTEINDALLESSERLGKLGYEPQIDVKKSRPPFFLLREGERLQLSWEDGLFAVGDGTKLTQSELESIAASSPELLSPNVSLRPLVQDYLFLTDTYVAGPGEVSYFAQIGPVYSILDLDMPAILPRAQLTLLTGPVQRAFEKHGLEVSDLLGDETSLKRALLKKAGALSEVDLISEAKSKLDALLDEMSRSLLDSQPEMEGPLETCRKKTAYQFLKLEEKMRALLSKKHETLTRQIEAARNHLFPLGKPQERVVNLCYYLTRFGLGFVEKILSSIEPFDFGHRILKL